MPVTDEQLRILATRLIQVGGVTGVVLGGSRARGEHTPESDFDLGVYYRPPLDIAGLRSLARQVAGPAATLTEPGGWGPWVDGGGWLQIDGDAVDWIYRDLDRVQQAWHDAQRGSFYFHSQVGHPLGVPDFAYAGEVALATVLSDPTGELSELQLQTRNYPAELSETLVARLSEATFLIGGARKATRRGDTTYVAGCLFRVVGVCVHALHGRAGQWLINEKGAVASAARLEIAPLHFDRRAHDLLAGIGRSEAELDARLDQAGQLVADTTEACRALP
jgi:Nucleotidyltransferase domain